MKIKKKSRIRKITIKTNIQIMTMIIENIFSVENNILRNNIIIKNSTHNFSANQSLKFLQDFLIYVIYHTQFLIFHKHIILI